jgi:GTP cyclohydrolase IA
LPIGAKTYKRAMMKSDETSAQTGTSLQHERIESQIRSILELLGEDTRREGLVDTPRRYAQAMEFLTCGYRQDLEEIVNGAIYTEPSSEIVIVRDIELF